MDFKTRRLSGRLFLLLASAVPAVLFSAQAGLAVNSSNEPTQTHASQSVDSTSNIVESIEAKLAKLLETSTQAEENTTLFEKGISAENTSKVPTVQRQLNFDLLLAGGSRPRTNAFPDNPVDPSKHQQPEIRNTVDGTFDETSNSDQA